MKHKRQTLSKTGEDGDSKDSPGGGSGGGGGGGKSKSEKGLLLLQDENSKSCQNCDLPTSGGASLGNGGTKGGNGGNGGGIADHSSNRANNNNSASVANNNTNNNNSSFNSNSNASSGASSVASSIGSSFDKMVTEEDSRSNESSGVMTSPGAGAGTGLVVKKLGCSEVLVKVEVENKSPPLMVLGSGGNVGMGKKTPPGCMVGKEAVSNSGGPGNGPMNSGAVLDQGGVVPGACAGSLTPSSTPGTPGQQSSPLSGVQSQSSSCGSGMAPGPNVMMMGSSGVTTPSGLFSQRPTRSSPTAGSGATIATATATASVTAVLQQHTGTSPGGSDMGMPPLIQIVRGAVPPPGAGGFQQQPQHEYRHCGPPTRADFRRQQQDVAMGMQQQSGCYSPRNMFQHHQQRLMYPGSDTSAYSRQQQHHAPNTSPRINGLHAPVTTPRTSAVPPVQQQQQQHRGSYHHQATATQQQCYHQQQSSAYPAQHAHPHSSAYNGYHHPQTSEHPGYHAVAAPYQQRMHNHHGYQQTQSYPSGTEHEGYMNSGSAPVHGYSGYSGGGVYPNSGGGGGNNAASAEVVHPGHPHHHMGTTSGGQQIHHAEYYTEGVQQSGTSVYGTPTHHMDTDYVSGPGMKSTHHQGHYYDHHQQHQHPHLMHQGGDASNIPSNYVVSSPDPFPLNSGTPTPGGTTGVTTTATAIAAATAAVMTPPASVQTPGTDSGSGGDGFNSFHHFYSEPAHHHHHPSGENSNSSSDFNFLSNLANDFAPEYYQLS